MGRWADLRSQVQTAVGGTTAADAQAWLVESARRLNSDAKFLTARVTIGTTTANVGTYSLGSTFIDLDTLSVDGQPYERLNATDMDNLLSGNAWPTGTGPWRWFAPDFDADGGALVSIYPVPDTSGLSIDGRQVIQVPAPGDWSSDDPPLPAEADAGIRHGAIAIGLSLQDEQLAEAGWHSDQRDAEVQKLTARKNSRIGSGGVRMRVPARER